MKALKLTQDNSYTANLVWSMIEGLEAHKINKGFTKRFDGLYEDCTGAVYAIDIQSDTDSVSIRFKPVAVAV